MIEGLARLKGPRGNGTAFAISSRFALTAFHCVGDRKKNELDKGEVRLDFGARSLQAEIVDGSGRLDVALLRLRGELPPGAALKRSYRVARGEPFIAFGFPSAVRGLDQAPVSGEVLTLDSSLDDGAPVLILQSRQAEAGLALSGLSGAPVLLQTTNQAIGVVRWNPVNVDGSPLKSGWVAATPLSALLKEAWFAAACAERGTAPYVGLRPYTEQQADLFYGRAELAERMGRKLGADPRFLIVVGASGVGKSSLVAAGLLPALRAANGERRISIHRPAEPGFLDALAALGERVATHAARDEVFVLDQLEELVTALTPVERARAVAMVEDVLDAPGSHTLVATLRSDFYGRVVDLSAALATQFDRAQISVSAAIGHAELAEIITKPADVAGLLIDPAVVERLIADAATIRGSADGERGSAAVASTLPLLQLVLERMWSEVADTSMHVTLETYERAGGLGGALARWAEEPFTGRMREHVGTALRMLVRCVRVSRDATTPPVRRRRLVDEVVPHGAPDGEARSLLDTLAQARLVVLDSEVDATTGKRRETVELIHDALLDGWPRLRAAVRDEHGFILWRQETEEAAASWRQSRDEGELLRGSRLAIATESLKARADDVPEDVAEFVRASAAAQAREREENVVGKAYREAADALPDDGVPRARLLKLALESYALHRTVLAYRMLEGALDAYARPTIVADVPGMFGAIAIERTGRLVALSQLERLGIVSIGDSSARLHGEFSLSALGSIGALAFAPNGERLAVLCNNRLALVDVLRKALVPAGDGAPSPEAPQFQGFPTLMWSGPRHVIASDQAAIAIWHCADAPRLIATFRQPAVIYADPLADGFVVLQNGDVATCFRGLEATGTWSDPERFISLDFADGLLLYATRAGTLRAYDTRREAMAFERRLGELFVASPQAAKRRFLVNQGGAFRLYGLDGSVRELAQAGMLRPETYLFSDDLERLAAEDSWNQIVTLDLTSGRGSYLPRFGYERPSVIDRTGTALASFNPMVAFSWSGTGNLARRYSVFGFEEDANEQTKQIVRAFALGDGGEDFVAVSSGGAGVRIERRRIPVERTQFEWQNLGQFARSGFFNYVRLAICPDACCVAAIEGLRESGRLCLWSAARMEPLPSDVAEPCFDCRWTLDHELIAATQTADGTVALSQLRPGTAAQRFAAFEARACSGIAVARRAPLLAAALWPAENRPVLEIVRRDDGRSVLSVPLGEASRSQGLLQRDFVSALDISAGGRFAGIACLDGTLLIIALADEKTIPLKGFYSVEAAPARPIAFAFSGDETRAAIFTQDGALRVVSTADGSPLATMNLATDNAYLQPHEVGVALDERGEHVVTAVHGDPKIRYWSVAESRQIGETQHQAFRLALVAVSADGRTFGFAYRMPVYGQPRPEMASLCLQRIIWPDEVVEAIRARLAPPNTSR